MVHVFVLETSDTIDKSQLKHIIHFLNTTLLEYEKEVVTASRVNIPAQASDILNILDKKEG